MAPKTKKSGSKKYRGKRRMIARSRRAPVPERASLKCERSFQLLNSNQVYQIYNTQLSSFPRAVNVAQAYQQYRIKKVTLRISPLADTFIAGGGTTVPYLYYMIDRTRSLQLLNTPSALKKIGAKPHRLDDKIVTFSFRPSVLNAAFDSLPPPGQQVLQSNQYKMSPWLATRDNEASITLWNADSTDHLGIVFTVENSAGTNVQYKLETLVEFEFQKPAIDLSIDETFPAPVDVETLAEDSEVIPAKMQ